MIIAQHHLLKMFYPIAMLLSGRLRNDQERRVLANHNQTENVRDNDIRVLTDLNQTEQKFSQKNVHQPLEPVVSDVFKEVFKIPITYNPEDVEALDGVYFED